MIHSDIPVISTEQMLEVDRLMIECYGIKLIQMMENAGRNLALHVKQQLNILSERTNICVVVGNGNNGGGGLVAARFLSNWGANVTVLIANSEDKFKEIPRQQFHIISHLPISVVFAGKNSHHINWEQCDLIVDAIFGYGLNRNPAGPIAEIINRINLMSCPVISLDSPSGLDTDKGYVSDTVIRAKSTLTLALPKRGLVNNRAEIYVGDLYVADISVPPLLYCQLGLEVPQIFSKDSVVLYKKKWPSESVLP